MMTVELRYYTDPACEWSWATEPQLRRLLWEFGDALAPRWVMAGLARTLEPADHLASLARWLEAAAATGMPCDPRIWLSNPISSTYPACQAVVAAREQGAEAGYRYLRRLREGLFCERLKLDHIDSLVAAAGAAGLDHRRFEIDLRSHAITEAFGADLEEVREHVPPLPLPTAAIERFGRCTTREIGSWPGLRIRGSRPAREPANEAHPPSRHLRRGPVSHRLRRRLRQHGRFRSDGRGFDHPAIRGRRRRPGGCLDCPDDEAAEEGNEFDCTLTAPNGDEVIVNVTITAGGDSFEAVVPQDQFK